MRSTFHEFIKDCPAAAGYLILKAQGSRRKEHSHKSIIHPIHPSCILHPVSSITFLNCIQPWPHFQAQKTLCLTDTSPFDSKNEHRNSFDPLLSWLLARNKRVLLRKEILKHL